MHMQRQRREVSHLAVGSADEGVDCFPLVSTRPGRLATSETAVLHSLQSAQLAQLLPHAVLPVLRLHRRTKRTTRWRALRASPVM